MNPSGYVDISCSAIKSSKQDTAWVPKRRLPGRPPVYKFDRPDNELSENERRLKGAVLKRRTRQNKAYHRKKLLRELRSRQVVPQTKPRLFSLPPLMDSSPRLLLPCEQEILGRYSCSSESGNYVLQPVLLQIFQPNNVSLRVDGSVGHT